MWGFDLPPGRMVLRLLRKRYNPRCEPHWSEQELGHKVEDAATTGYRSTSPAATCACAAAVCNKAECDDGCDEGPSMDDPPTDDAAPAKPEAEKNPPSTGKPQSPQHSRRTGRDCHPGVQAVARRDHDRLRLHRPAYLSGAHSHHRLWLIAQYRSSHPRGVPNNEALSNALNVIEATAIIDGPLYSYVRIAAHKGEGVPPSGPRRRHGGGVGRQGMAQVR